MLTKRMFDRIPVGTRSVLYGAHAFWCHPFMVALAWWKMYGFPWDPRLWFAFFLHDAGYWGKSNMDGPEGETHPELGAKVMGRLFDRPCRLCGVKFHEQCEPRPHRWHDFCLYHSRSYARSHGKPVSSLCAADKLATVITPKWLYLFQVSLTGEYVEYMDNVVEGWIKGSTSISDEWMRAAINRNKSKWFDELRPYMERRAWSEAMQAEYNIVDLSHERT